MLGWFFAVGCPLEVPLTDTLWKLSWAPTSGATHDRDHLRSPACRRECAADHDGEAADIGRPTRARRDAVQASVELSARLSVWSSSWCMGRPSRQPAGRVWRVGTGSVSHDRGPSAPPHRYHPRTEPSVDATNVPRFRLPHRAPDWAYRDRHRSRHEQPADRQALLTGASRPRRSIEPSRRRGRRCTHRDHFTSSLRSLRPELSVPRFPNLREIEAAREPLYTVPEWAFPEELDLTAIDGDLHVADGVRIISTPGHTPGHQSVLIEDGSGTRTIVCCQAAWDTASFEAASLGDDGWSQETGSNSIARLRGLDPDAVLLSHDPNTWRRKAT